MKAKILLASNPKLRISDGYNVQNILKKLSKEERNIINEQLEVNYTRGFQQGISMIYHLMKFNKVNSILFSEIKCLMDLAGDLRYTYSNFRTMSYYYFGDVFYNKAKKILFSIFKYKG